MLKTLLKEVWSPEFLYDAYNIKVFFRRTVHLQYSLTMNLASYSIMGLVWHCGGRLNDFFKCEPLPSVL
jgi:hypothetical protein